MKKRVAIALLLLLASCGTPLEKPMRDFNAYFNSYYNAQKVYEEGLEQNLNQSLPINPELPIPVYPAPSRGGAQSFEDAIAKGAQILRDHKGTRFENSAIELIGKSYYYRQEYFSAIEKFAELQNIASGEMQQNALYWQGRVYFQMNAIEEGITFLENEMDLIENWDPGVLAKTSVVLAQLYVANEQWREAYEQLQGHVPQMEHKKDRDRAYFLMGQVAEQLGDFELAKEAYSNVRTSNPDYDLVFHAMRKEAIVARSLGEYERAYDLFRSLSRDDKFTAERADLIYDLGRTLQLMGSTTEAARQYGSLLRDDRIRPSSETKAKTYYGIAEIYRYDLGDYVMAAAYYDSASMQRVDLEKLPAGFDAEEMAESFGEYATIQLEVAELDSLLWLGQLEPSALDSVLAVIQERLEEEQRREQERLEQQQQNQTSTAVIIDPSQIQDAAASSEFGFLNAQNLRMQEEASLQFRAVWGERPLGDLWRRRAEITGTRNTAQTGAGASASTGVDVDAEAGTSADAGVGSGTDATGNSGVDTSAVGDDASVSAGSGTVSESEIGTGEGDESDAVASAEIGEGSEVGDGSAGDGSAGDSSSGTGTGTGGSTSDVDGIVGEDTGEGSLGGGAERQNASTRPHAPLVDISRVPFTEQEQDSVRKLIDELHYRLANVYFLSLEEPDMALMYYENVIERDKHKTLIPKALYSLTELHLLEDQTEEAMFRGEQLLEYYPESVFAVRIADRLGVDFEPPEQERERTAQMKIEELEEFMADSLLSVVERAEQYRALADSLDDGAVKPYLYLEAATLYIEEAKHTAPDSLPDRKDWFLAQERWEQQKQELAEVKDSVRIVLADSVLGNVYRERYFRDRFDRVLPDSLRPDTKLGEREMEFFQQISDSTVTEPVWFDLFPFRGALWDSARVALDEYLAIAGSSPQKPRITKLAASLVVPEDPNAVVEPIMEELAPDSAQMDSLGVGVIGVDSLSVGTVGMDSLGVDSLGVESMGVDSMGVESAGVDSSEADSVSTRGQEEVGTLVPPEVPSVPETTDTPESVQPDSSARVEDVPDKGDEKGDAEGGDEGGVGSSDREDDDSEAGEDENEDGENNEGDPLPK